MNFKKVTSSIVLASMLISPTSLIHASEINKISNDDDNVIVSPNKTIKLHVGNDQHGIWQFGK